MHTVDKVRITVLADNYVAYPQPLLGEWGLALLVEVWSQGKKYTILYDTGQTGTALINNMTTLDIDMNSIQYVVLSHGHYDHTGGLGKLFEACSKKLTIVAHPSIFEKKIVMRGGILRYVGIPLSRKEVEDRSYLLLTRDFLEVVPGVYFSGEVLRYGYPEYTPDMYVLTEDGKLIRDVMHDDAALVINLRDKGLVILTGCGHSGILNILEHCMTMIGVRKVYAIVGGLHQEREPDEKVLELCERFKKLDIKVILPLHCTGVRAVNIMRQALQDRVLIGGVGTVLEL